MDRRELFKGLAELEVMDIIEHGLKTNDNFLFDTSRIVDKVLISRNQLKRHSRCPFYDFNYPSYETCKELIKNHKYSEVDFIVVLFDWYELFDKDTFLTPEALTLALYLKRYKYIKENIELENENENILKIHYPSEVGVININSFFDELNTGNIDLRNAHDTSKERFKKNAYLFNSYDYIEGFRKRIEYTKYEIVNDFDYAHSLYKDGDRSNEVLSKLFSVDPDKYDEYMGESDFFLVFARHDIDCRHIISKKYHKFKYNILYINILFPNSTQLYQEYIDIPEYNLFVAAVKMNNKRLIRKLLKLYKEHGKFYKKMDLEKQIFIDEELHEIPEVEPLNLVTGDILNPYHELKNHPSKKGKTLSVFMPAIF
ncbi:hypothetical protein CLIB1423_06S06128 [[Candida] railenensis]|uniref:Uncharacterized protein n=1 Tax=[Candida] railenensis TaxID=45579 RepID=A0A9P0QPA9_9ASCO|nr:hypothetical protein CLIB1423_06S06128 [[Candida] railenensis]